MDIVYLFAAISIGYSFRQWHAVYKAYPIDKPEYQQLYRSLNSIMLMLLFTIITLWFRKYKETGNVL